MNKNEEALKNGSFTKLILNLCIPSIVIMLVMVIYNMADTYFIGQAGDPFKVAAVSLCGPVSSILSGLGTLLGNGGCTVISLALGKKENDKIRATTSLCFYSSLVIGVLFSVIVLCNLERISYLIGSDADTVEYTCEYLRVLAVGAPVILFGQVFTNLIRADGAAKQSMITNGIGTITNIILDPLLISGLGMGVTGAAVATVIGNTLSCVYLLYYVLKKQKAFSLSPRYFTVRKKIVIPVLTLGLPMACSTILMSCSHMFMNNVLVSYGSITVAASNVSGKVGMLIGMLAIGMCTGMQPAISYNYGAGNLKRMRSIIRNTGIMTVVVGTVLTVVCFLWRNQIVAAFIDNEEVIALGQRMVYASLLMGPFIGIYQLCTTFLQSTGKAGFATFVALLDKGLIYIPMMFLLNSLFGLSGLIFTGAVTDALSTCIALGLSLYWNRKITQAAGRSHGVPASAEAQ